MKKLTIALLLLLTLCSCSSKQGETNEKDTVDSLEAIKQDSIRMVQEKKLLQLLMYHIRVENLLSAV